MEKIRIGITTGDINSISLEVILKSLSNESIFQYIIPIIYGNIKITSYHKNIVNLSNMSIYVLNKGEKPKHNRVNLVNCWNDNININLGKPSPEGGQLAILALDQAVEDLKNNELDALVTGPIHKHSMKMAGFKYMGHTQYLKDKTGSNEVLMMMVSNSLKIGLVTDHIPLKDVCSALTKELILSKINIMEDSLIKDFGIDKPNIAVLGLNPHAGEEGMLGTEEEEIIRPAIIESKKNGKFVSGPYSADGFFGSSLFKKFDGILSMYHDQGLIGFKSLSFSDGVNYTAGLPFVRTSPDHGTAFDIAGQNLADHHSMLNAIYTAKDVVNQRLGYIDARKDVLKKKPKLSEELSE
ncbi:MAG: 4-hydroxythreonine-4-phosphate dehydrogenase PdxA [Saprospiraceae bacterium]